MNHRLQEELRRCEKERLRILERIKYLSGEKELVIESVDGVKKTFKVTQINIENRLKSLEDQKGRLVSDEEMVRQSEEIVRMTDEEIFNLGKEIDRVRLERDEVAQKFADLEYKYKQEMDTTEGRKWQTDSLHRMHVKLLATRSFEETL